MSVADKSHDKRLQTLFLGSTDSGANDTGTTRTGSSDKEIEHDCSTEARGTAQKPQHLAAYTSVLGEGPLMANHR